MRHCVWLSLIVLAIVLLAATLRLPRLEVRPMHSDEAIQADKFGTLLEQGLYRYDPRLLHGPTLNYLTLIPAWLTGTYRYSDVTETTLRIVPASFGLLVVLLPLALKKDLGETASLAASALAAVSPVMAYYSRYYIHEMLLVSFTFGTIVASYRYWRTRRGLWAVLTGACVGLMLASKETAVVSIFAMALALGANLILSRRLNRQAAGPEGSTASVFSELIGLAPPVHWLMGATAAMMVVGLLFSSFLTNPAGITDFFVAFGAYFRRASGDRIHFHPWYYYFKLLLYFKEAQGPRWTEGLILALGGIGCVVALRRNINSRVCLSLLRFMAFYTIILAVIYSFIPYKTPWCLLSFYQGMIVLAGVGTAELFKAVPAGRARWVMGLLLSLGGLHLAQQTVMASFKFASDPANPYVYAHTGTDVFLIRDRLEKLAETRPDGRHLPIQVISRENLWPLPWYLRGFSEVRWWNGVPDKVPMAPVILATPDMEPALIRRLYELPPPGQREMYMRLFDRYVELRPGVEVRGYIAKSAWERMEQ